MDHDSHHVDYLRRFRSCAPLLAPRSLVALAAAVLAVSMAVWGASEGYADPLGPFVAISGSGDPDAVDNFNASAPLSAGHSEVLMKVSVTAGDATSVFSRKSRARAWAWLTAAIWSPGTCGGVSRGRRRRAASLQVKSGDSGSSFQAGLYDVFGAAGLLLGLKLLAVGLYGRVRCEPGRLGSPGQRSVRSSGCFERRIDQLRGRWAHVGLIGFCLAWRSEQGRGSDDRSGSGTRRAGRSRSARNRSPSPMSPFRTRPSLRG